MADSTLAAIRAKIRRLARSPSESQITTEEIDEYVNTFVLYDFPEQLRLFALRDTFTFYTQPNVDTYESSVIVGDPLYNFKNEYITVHDPVYVAGRRVFLSQSREQFYGLYPMTNSISDTGSTGDGFQVLFTGTLSTIPVLRSSVIFNSIDINGNGIKVYDNGAGILTGDGIGTIDYITGAWSVTFNTAPEAAEVIYSQTIPYQAALPSAILYFANKFVVRPVPDKVYAVNMEVYKRPTELLAAGNSPDLEQWWQYIALASAIKIFYDRSDIDSVERIMPEYKNQEILVLRRTIVQQTKERTATIYTDGINNMNNNDWFGNNNY